MTGRDPRDLLAELEREEKAMRRAESARRTIRMGRTVTGVVDDNSAPDVKPSVWVRLGFVDPNLKDGFKAEHVLSPQEVWEVYDALAEVFKRHERRAQKIADELGTKVKW